MFKVFTKLKKRQLTLISTFGKLCLGKKMKPRHIGMCGKKTAMANKSLAVGSELRVHLWIFHLSCPLFDAVGHILFCVLFSQAIKSLITAIFHFLTFPIAQTIVLKLAAGTWSREGSFLFVFFSAVHRLYKP